MLTSATTVSNADRYKDTSSPGDFASALQGGCRAVLAVLQSPLVTIEAAGMCLNLLTQLSTNSVALMSLVDMVRVMCTLASSA